MEAEVAAGVDLDIDRNVQQPGLNAVLKQQGLRELRPVQALAIQNGLFFRRSMLVFSPSGSGKTLIGELAAANTVLEGYGKASYLVPLKALATEKYKHFVRYLSPLGVRVEISIGDYDLPPEDIEKADIIIMTYEKLDSIMRSDGRAVRGKLACMVVDEVHVLGEKGRGPRLESLLIRASRAMAGVQLVALSATVANPAALNGWLSSLGHDSLLVISTERPVPLKHEVVLARDNFVAIQEILRRVTREGGQVLVFARTRKNAEDMARRLASSGAMLATRALRDLRNAAAFHIKQSVRRSELPLLVMHGVAYHHAGLSATEREQVEAAFKDRVLGAICCTTTLSAGINMPARAVVIEDYKQRAIPDARIAVPGRFHKLSPGSPVSFDPMPRNVFHQIAGRAGRAGYDTEGTAFVLVHSSDEGRWVREHYFTAAGAGGGGGGGGLVPLYEPLESMMGDRDVMLEQLLVAIHEARELTRDDVKAFFAMSFFQHGRAAGALPVDAVLRLDAVSARGLAVAPDDVGCSARVIEAHGERITVETIGHGNDSNNVNTNTDTNTNITAKKHVVQLSSAGGLSCSCHGAGASGLDLCCVHLKVALHAVLGREPGLARALDRMLTAALDQECYVDYLVDHGFVEDRGNGTFACLPFGSLVARLYILPRIAVLAKDRIVEGQAAGGGPVRVPWIFETIRELATAARGPGIKDEVYLAAWLWIEEEPVDVVLAPGERPVPELASFPCKEGTVYPGDFASGKADIRRWCRVLGRVASFLNFNGVAAACSALELRVQHGARSELLQLITEISGVGRVRARMLHDAGFTTVQAVATADPADLHARTLLPEDDCRHVIGHASGTLQGMDAGGGGGSTDDE